MRPILTHRLSFVLTVLLVAVLTPVIFAGCPAIAKVFGEPGPLAVTIEQERLTLGWDISTGALSNTESAVVASRFYFRERGTRDWTLIATIAVTENPTFTVVADRVLGDRRSGAYEFGVSSITRHGEESMIHSSVDFDARPRGGWYIRWTRP